ncbi:hypothetical protein CsSME_00020116 [Camellia sinensis var. sinensis]
MMSRRHYYYHVSDADAVDYPSSFLVTDPDHNDVRSAGTLPTPQPTPYVDVRCQPPYLPDVAHFTLLGPLSSAWFLVPRLKARIELLKQSSKLFMRWCLLGQI